MNRFAFPLVFIALLMSLGCDSKKTEPAPPEPPAFSAPEGVKNSATFSPNVITAGQPTVAQFGEFAERGVTTVIDLRTDGEVNFDEKSAVTKLGMTYVNIPIRGDAGLTTENTRAFDEAMKKAAGQKVLVHCGSSNRVGALLALQAGLIEGKKPDQAMELGKKAGLTSLTTAVQEVLKANAK